MKKNISKLSLGIIMCALAGGCSNDIEGSASNEISNSANEALQLRAPSASELCAPSLNVPSIDSAKLKLTYLDKGQPTKMTLDVNYVETSQWKCAAENVYETVRYDLKRFDCSNPEDGEMFLSEFNAPYPVYPGQVTHIKGSTKGHTTYSTPLYAQSGSFYGVGCKYKVRAFSAFQNNSSSLLMQSAASEEISVELSEEFIQ